MNAPPVSPAPAEKPKEGSSLDDFLRVASELADNYEPSGIIVKDAPMTDAPAPADTGSAATPQAELERQIMDSNVPKNEREWWAAHEIERLRAAMTDAPAPARGKLVCWNLDACTTPNCNCDELRLPADELPLDEWEQDACLMIKHAHGTPVNKDKHILTLIAAVRKQREEIERLEAENFSIAAGMCKGELIGDEYGNFHCSLVTAAEAEVERLREEAHYANGVADLAMEHREAAEADAARLTARVGELVEPLRRIAFDKEVSGYAGDPTRWPSIIAYLALGGRIKDGVCLDDEGALLAGMSQWQPIETAPKDGRELLLYGYYIYPGDTDRTEYWKVCEWDDGCWTAGEGSYQEGVFSHWTSLARPPEPEERSDA